MDAARTQKIGEVLKSVATLGKNVKQPNAAAAAPNVKKALTEATSRLPIASSGWIQTGFYVLAGLLAIGIILLAVDQWITPIFQRVPGGAGYIPVPGTDTTQVFWETYRDIADIPIRAPNENTKAASVLEDRTLFAITMDVYIADENTPSGLPSGANRTFFVLGTPAAGAGSTDVRKITAYLDKGKNTLYVNFNTTTNLSLKIDNVPIRKPFQLGIVLNNTIGEAYLNGQLVRSLSVGNPANIKPLSGDKIYATSNISENSVNTATGIKVLNVRTFGYVPTPQEMLKRAETLNAPSAFL